jgi:hypothetical protein
MAWRLVHRAVLLAVIVTAVHVVLLVSPLNPSEGRATFPDAWGDKHALVTAPGDHRIILVGGSNVGFGVDSALIEQETHRRAANLGLHAGIGLSLMLHEVADVARRGDLVIVIPEYELFFADSIDGELAAIQVLQSNWSALAYVSTWSQWRALSKYALMANRLAALNRLDQAKRFVRRDFTGLIPPRGAIAYSREAFDGHGDATAHLSLPSNPEAVAAGIDPISGELNPRAFAALKKTAELIVGRGGQVLIVFPAVAASYWSVNQSRIDMVAASMPSQWTRTIPHDWVYQDDLFYDTHYHLAREGRTRRTRQLLIVIREALAPQEAARRHPTFFVLCGSSAAGQGRDCATSNSNVENGR